MSESKARSHAPEGSEQGTSRDRLVAGRYRLVRELGRGGMGVVWLGEDQLVGRRVAVKELRPSHVLSGADRQVYARRALQEARGAARIDHPNAVTLYDVLPASAADDAVYLIMELVEGPTLAQLIGRDGALPGPRVAGYGLQLLDVLQVAHGLGLVHRDIKPANIMIAAADQVKLTDFGIAHMAGDTRLTRSGVMGTQAYIAPELFESSSITAAADLWSLGATLYYAVVGRGAFDRDSTGATLRAIVLDEIPVPPCGPGLAAAITGMLRRYPAQRATIEQTRAHLRQAAAGESAPSSGPAFAWGAGQDQGTTREPSADSGTDQKPDWDPAAETRRAATPWQAGQAIDPSFPSGLPRPSGRRKRVLTMAAIAALMLAAGSGAFALTSSLAGHGQAAALPSSPTARANLPSSPDSGPPSPSQPAPAPSTSASAGTTVSIAAGAAASPAASQVQKLLDRYFTAINEHDYSQYSSVLDQRMQEDNPSTSFAAGYATTTDSAETITGISSTGNGDLAATVTFNSHQDPADSPNHTSCTDWAITLYLVPQGSSYLIGSPPSSYRPSYQAC